MAQIPEPLVVPISPQMSVQTREAFERLSKACIEVGEAMAQMVEAMKEESDED